MPKEPYINRKRDLYDTQKRPADTFAALRYDKRALDRSSAHACRLQLRLAHRLAKAPYITEKTARYRRKRDLLTRADLSGNSQQIVSAADAAAIDYSQKALTPPSHGRNGRNGQSGPGMQQQQQQRSSAGLQQSGGARRGGGGRGAGGTGVSGGAVVVVGHELMRHRIEMVACGWQHTLLLTHAAAVFSFGFGGYGALGHASKNSCRSPRCVEVAFCVWRASGGEDRGGGGG